MKIKIIKQIDETITFEFYNAKDEKINYEIAGIKEEGLGVLYTLKGLRISAHGKRKDADE